jgi:peptidyl-prolyl cis-trans isomerase B (cyclophilin B)
VSNKRQRALARAKYTRQQNRRTARFERSVALKQVVSGLAVVALIGAYAVMHPTGKGADVAAQPSASSTAAQPVASCAAPAATRADDVTYKQVPKDATAASAITLTTNCGDITIAVAKAAPKTGAAMSFLASSKFFDGTKCHRLTTSGIFVLQCGDPAGNGTGGPGFTFSDENLPKGSGTVTYKRGTVAMANSGANTNGSQFFLVYGDSPLGPNYSVWGTLDDASLKVIDAIAKAGVSGGAADGQPAQSVVISQAVTTP